MAGGCLGTLDFLPPEKVLGFLLPMLPFLSAPTTIWHEGKALAGPWTLQSHLPSLTAHHLSPWRHMARWWVGLPVCPLS